MICLEHCADCVQMNEGGKDRRKEHTFMGRIEIKEERKQNNGVVREVWKFLTVIVGLDGPAQKSVASEQYIA